MENNWKVFMVISAIVIIFAGVLIFASSSNQKDETSTASVVGDGSVAGVSTQKENNQESGYDGEYIERLAIHLSDAGMVLYGAYWCSHCNEQKELFKEAVKYIDYVECDPEGENANPDECAAQDIKAYPTWVYQGEKFQGTQSLSELAKITGFTDSVE